MLLRYRQLRHLHELTFVLALYTPLQSIRGPSKAVLVHLGMHKLENRDQAMLSTRVLTVNLISAY